MPTPSNAPSSSTGGLERQDPQAFEELTERQQMPQLSQAIKGLGKRNVLLLEKVGIVAKIRIIVKASFEATEETKTILNPGFPFRLIREIALEANGVTGIIDCSAMTLEQRKRRIFRNPVSAILKSPKVGEKLAKGVHEVEFAIEVPIAHDMLSLIGCLLAQNEETGLSIDVNWADEEEIANSGPITKFEGEIEWGTTVFSLASTTIGKDTYTILPDLSAFHGILEQETALVGTGKRSANLIRTAGQLLCYTASILNGPAAEISPATWTRFAIEYGGNKDPLVWAPARELLEENADDYDGPLNVEGLHFLAVDQERDNPTRDMIIPELLTELKGTIGVPAVGVNANAQIVTSQETLYPAV
jgi:hypothetical protein